jgi:AcrR family transcriptional regulator
MRDAGLGRDEVVRAALQIADTEGVDRITMRRVSKALGVTPMALYRYLPDKAALVDVVVDESLRALPAVDPAGAVLTELRRFCGGLHELLVDHPGLARAVSDRALEGPVATSMGDQILELLLRHGLGEREASSVLVSAFSLTLGSALYWASRHPEDIGRQGIDARENKTTVMKVRGYTAIGAEGRAVFHDALDRLVSSYLVDSEPRACGEGR